MNEPIYVDATMLYRWRELAPVGIVRLERLLASHLRNRSVLGRAEFVLWDSGYRPTTDIETAALDALLAPSATPPKRSDPVAAATGWLDQVGDEPSGGWKATARRTARRTFDRVPDHLRPFAEQAAWSTATLAVESSRHARRR